MENAEGGISKRKESLEWYGNKTLFYAHSLSLHTHCHYLQTCEQVNITNLPLIFIHITRYVCKRCQVMDTYEECLCCQEVAPISEKMYKHLKCLTEMIDFGEIT